MKIRKDKKITLALFCVVFLLLIGLSSCIKTPIPITGEVGTMTATPTPTPKTEFVSTSILDTITDFFTYLPMVSRSIQPTSTPMPTPGPTVPAVIPTLPPPGDGDWTMVAANPYRTSWSPEEVSGNLGIEWYRPIEAYIPQNVQLIASGGLIYISTAKGLYALNIYNGETVWRFDTEMPLGNSPTIADGVLYVGGYDRKLYALRATDGVFLWAFDGATAGFSTNPLVLEGKVLLGNRDGYFYAIGAHGTSQQGQLIWKYKTDGLIDLSAAAADGIVYFASNDNHAYALRISSGSLVWKSALLPGDGYQSYWPVIYGNTVVFAAASGYRTGFDPGTSSILDDEGNAYGKVFDMDRDAVFGNASYGSIIGPAVPNQTWANGKQVLDYSIVTEYLEDNPGTTDDLHKPWRRSLIVLNRADGREYTFDSDGDGFPEYIPALMWGTHSGNRYPPLMGSDGILYFSNLFQNFYIPQGKITGWLIGTPYLSLAGGQGAVDEPQAISAGGSIIYRNLCCDRVGDFFDLENGRAGVLWDYNAPLSVQIQGYDEMWYGTEDGDTVRLRGNYGTQNGIYHNHGDQNPLIPYQGMLFVHRSNAIIAFGPNAQEREQPLLTVENPDSNTARRTENEIRASLTAEIQKILDAGLLRPGYYNAGQYSVYSQFANYFENPGETLYTLSLAYPHLNSVMQSQVRQYLLNTFDTYFDPNMISRTGWKDGEAREVVPIPPEAAASIENFGPIQNSNPKFSWAYPQFNFYAMWKYVQIVPEDTAVAYQLSKSRLIVPVPVLATNDYLLQRPYEINAYIAGYTGFLELQSLAGMAAQDSTLRTAVTNELNRLINLRVQNFSKDTYWVDGVGSYHLRTMNISQNFLFLVPELAEDLRQGAYQEIETALNEYNSIAPYWFVSRYNATVNEGVRQNLYDSLALFQAKSLILNESQSELSYYLDVPAFYRGDLNYIQNLVRALEAP